MHCMVSLKSCLKVIWYNRLLFSHFLGCFLVSVPSAMLHSIQQVFTGSLGKILKNRHSNDVHEVKINFSTEQVSKKILTVSKTASTPSSAMSKPPSIKWIYVIKKSLKFLFPNIKNELGRLQDFPYIIIKRITEIYQEHHL